MIKEINSGFNNISFTIYWNDVECIMKKYTKSKAIIKGIKECFMAYTVEELIKDFISSRNRRNFIRLLIIYNKVNFRFEREILKDYLYFCDLGLKSVTEFRIKKTFYLTYNFNFEPLLINTLQNQEYVNSRGISYASAFFFFTILFVIFAAVNKYIKEDELRNFCRFAYGKLHRGILTGFEAYTEIETDFFYSLFAEELLALETADPKRLTISKSQLPSLEYTILDNTIIQEAYEKYGWSDINYEADYTKDRNNNNKFRIVRGSTPKRIKFIYKRASGCRILGRLFLRNPNYNIRIDNLYDSGLSCVRNFIFFCFSAIYDNLNHIKSAATNHSQLYTYAKQFKGKRYVPEIISTVVLMTQSPELQEEIIRKYFGHKLQRQKILDEVKKLNKLQKQPHMTVLKDFIEEMRYYYAW